MRKLLSLVTCRVHISTEGDYEGLAVSIQPLPEGSKYLSSPVSASPRPQHVTPPHHSDDAERAIAAYLQRHSAALCLDPPTPGQVQAEGEWELSAAQIWACKGQGGGGGGGGGLGLEEPAVQGPLCLLESPKGGRTPRTENLACDEVAVWTAPLGLSSTVGEAKVSHVDTA
jgi:hypothetical protein